MNVPVQADPRQDVECREDVQCRQDLRCRVARDDADLAVHHAIRRAVFVAEQRVFAESDHDSRDDDATCLRVVGFVDGAPAGTVRIYPLDPFDPTGDWQGDRLAVMPGFRSAGLGRPLVRFAVATMAAHGGRRMIAHVQTPNRTFFRRLGWRQLGAPEIYLGRPHVLMDIEAPDRGAPHGAVSASATA